MNNDLKTLLEDRRKAHGVKLREWDLRPMNIIEKFCSRIGKGAKLEEQVIECELCGDTGMLHIDERTAINCYCVKRKTALRRLQACEIPFEEIKSLNEFVPKDGNQRNLHRHAKRLVEDFRPGRPEKNMIITGQQGSGKTAIAFGIIKPLIMRKRTVNVVVMNYIQSIQKLKGLANDAEANEKARNVYVTAELLVIEDMYNEKTHNVTRLSSPDNSQLFPIIDARYKKRLPTIVTTVHDLQTLRYIKLDIADRLIEHGVVFSMKEEKYNHRIASLNERGMPSD